MATPDRRSCVLNHGFSTCPSTVLCPAVLPVFGVPERIKVNIATQSFLNDLTQAGDHAWSLLERGAHDRQSSFHAPVIATASPEGPQVRTVTLRHADRATATVRFNADARGGLVAQLRAEPRAALHAYSTPDKTQLRLQTRARLHLHDTLAELTWESCSPSAKRCYLVPPPGSTSDLPSSGLSADLERRAPTPSESAEGFERFCVVELQIAEVEWLHLHAIHKRRARFTLREGQWVGAWLTP